MKFVVKKGTETFDKLNALRLELDKCRQQTAELVESLGGSKWLANGSLAGGFRGIVLDSKPADWKEVDNRCYFPKKIKKNAELLQRIYALPIIKDEAINSIIGFGGFQITNSMRVIKRPGFAIGEDFCLIQFPEDVEYTPNADMEEITVSEYRRLEKEFEEGEEI